MLSAGGAGRSAVRRLRPVPAGWILGGNIRGAVLPEKKSGEVEETIQGVRNALAIASKWKRKKGQSH